MQRNLIFRPPPNPRIKTLAVQHRQHKKRSQLIPEFSTTAWYPKTHKISNIQKLIPSSNSGEYQEGDQPQMTTEDILVGTWHTPEQFVNKAQHSPHPMEENALHKITKDATEFVAKSPVKLVSIERKKNLLKAKNLARQLESQEKELHEGLPTSIQKVPSGMQTRTLKIEKMYARTMLVVFLTFSSFGSVHVSVTHATSPLTWTLKQAFLNSIQLTWTL